MAASDKPRISSAKLALAIRRVRAEKEDLDLVASDPIAVIGMGCRFPGGGNSPEEFWTALREGRDGITAIPAGRWKDAATLPLQLRRGGYIEEIDGFDAAFFGISPREAQQMDPQQRLLLEVTWEALWDAGIDPAQSFRYGCRGFHRNLQQRLWPATFPRYLRADGAWRNRQRP